MRCGFDAARIQIYSPLKATDNQTRYTTSSPLQTRLRVWVTEWNVPGAENKRILPRVRMNLLSVLKAWHRIASDPTLQTWNTRTFRVLNIQIAMHYDVQVQNSFAFHLLESDKPCLNPVSMTWLRYRMDCNIRLFVYSWRTHQNRDVPARSP